MSNRQTETTANENIDFSLLGDNATPSTKILACEVAMLAKIAKADGRVSKSEVLFLNQVLDESKCRAEVKESLKHFANRQKSKLDDIFDFAAATAKFAKVLSEDDNFSICSSVFINIFRMALIDESMGSNEVAILRSISNAMDLGDEAFDIVGQELVKKNVSSFNDGIISLLQHSKRRTTPLLNRKKKNATAGYRAKATELCSIACSLRTQSEFHAEDLRRIQAETVALESRANDPSLYLGIVGEFSTGKSTFINALLGFELLKEDVLQGTTCAPTLLSKGNDFTITVNFQNGKRPAKHPASNASRRSRWCVGDDMRHVLECVRKASEFINKYTAEEDVSKTVADVRIEIPGDHWHLPDNIVVVDTPGLNADNPRHGMVAHEAIYNLCDLCCVLTAASIPCPASLVHFVSENLHEMQGRCVCVATQVDRVRRRERDGLVNYISERLASEGLSFKKVFGVAPIYAAHPDERHAEAESFRAGFSDFVRVLSTMLEEARNDVISEKTGRLIKHLADEMLRPMLESMRDEFRRRKNALASNRLSNPDLFFYEASRKALATLQSEGTCAIQENRFSLDYAIDDICDEVARKIDNAYLVDDIKSALSLSLSDRLNSPMRKALQGYANRCADFAQKILEQIKSEFNVAYSNLGRNVPDLLVARTLKISLQPPQVSFASAVGAVVSLDRRDNDQRLSNGGTGAAIGAAAGSLLFGIGAIPGALIGGALGAIFGGKDISEYKQVAKNSLSKSGKELRQKVSKYFEEQCQSTLEQIASEMDGQLDFFYHKQSPKIRAAIEKEEAEIAKIDRLISDANADLRSLTPFINPS